MKTVSEHNKDFRQKDDRNAGVLCNFCKTEMFFPYPGVQLLSSPPQMDVECPTCEIRDRIYMKTIREHNQEAEAARHQKKMAGVSCDYCKSQGVTSEMHFLVQDPLGLTYAMCENCGAVEKYDEYLVPTTK